MRRLTADNSLKQLVKGPTHEHGNRLDLVFANMPDIVKAKVGPRVTDHHMITVQMKLSMPKVEEVQRRVHVFGKADWELLSATIDEESWRCVDTGRVDEATEAFTSTLRKLIDASIPQKVIKEQKGSHPWVSQKVVDAVWARNQAIGSEREVDAITECSEVLLHARVEYQERMKKELGDMAPGSKQWWKKSRELLDQKSTAATIPALRKTEAAEWCLSAKSKADLLAEAFEEKNEMAPAGERPPEVAAIVGDGHAWEPSQITENSVERELKALRGGVHFGP